MEGSMRTECVGAAERIAGDSIRLRLRVVSVDVKQERRPTANFAESDHEETDST